MVILIVVVVVYILHKIYYYYYNIVNIFKVLNNRTNQVSVKKRETIIIIYNIMTIQYNNVTTGVQL